MATLNQAFNHGTQWTFPVVFVLMAHLEYNYMHTSFIILMYLFDQLNLSLKSRIQVLASSKWDFKYKTKWKFYSQKLHICCVTQQSAIKKLMAFQHAPEIDKTRKHLKH